MYSKLFGNPGGKMDLKYGGISFCGTEICGILEPVRHSRRTGPFLGRTREPSGKNCGGGGAAMNRRIVSEPVQNSTLQAPSNRRFAEPENRVFCGLLTAKNHNLDRLSQTGRYMQRCCNYYSIYSVYRKTIDTLNIKQ
jgi:hypothetical protein